MCEHPPFGTSVSSCRIPVAHAVGCLQQSQTHKTKKILFVFFFSRGEFSNKYNFFFLFSVMRLKLFFITIFLVDFTLINKILP